MELSIQIVVVFMTRYFLKPVIYSLIKIKHSLNQLFPASSIKGCGFVLYELLLILTCWILFTPILFQLMSSIQLSHNQSNKREFETLNAYHFTLDAMTNEHEIKTTKSNKPLTPTIDDYTICETTTTPPFYYVCKK